MSDNSDRRTHCRYYVGERGSLVPLEWYDLYGELDIVVEDISRGGLGIRLNRSLPVQLAVKLVLPQCTIVGEIVHCRCDGPSFVAGIRAQKAADHVDKLRKPAPPPPPTDLSPLPGDCVVTERVTLLGIRIRRRTLVRQA